MPMVFKDRVDAGRQLAHFLMSHCESCDEDTIILGIARGGVIVASEITKAFNLPLNAMVSRKIGKPGQPEFGIGSVAPNDTVILNQDYLEISSLSKEEIQKLVDAEKQEVTRRMNIFYGEEEQMPNLKNKTVILVDDGIATGLTIMAAIKAIKKMQPKQLVLAVGACSAECYKKLHAEVDDMICIACSIPFYAVSTWYKNFDKISTDTIIKLLQENKEMLAKKRK